MKNLEKFEPRKIEYRETEEEKEKEEREMIKKAPLGYQDKKDLALTYLSEKPASLIDISASYYKEDEGKKEDEILNELELKRDRIQKILEETGFIYGIKKFKFESTATYNAGYSFGVARNLEDFSRLRKALSKKDNREIGLALGYPETAVEAYINNKVLDYNKLPKKVKRKLIKEQTSKFLDFKLSEDNWREEIKTVERHQKVIKEKFPELYNYITKYGLDSIIERKLDSIAELKTPLSKLKNLIRLIDENVFPENPLPIKIVEKIESKYEGKITPADHYFDENEKGEMINEYYKVNRGINKEDYKFIDLKSIAIHETRHRIQHTLKSELFNKENIKGFKEKYPALTFLIDRFSKELSPEDFDACLVENLSLFLIKNSVSLSEILENIISKNPKEIFENIEKLAKEHNFEIPNLLISENFEIHCDEKIRQVLGNEDKEKFDQVKNFVDEIFDSKREIKERAKIYVFSNKEKYSEFLKKNFPDIKPESATFDKKTKSIFKLEEGISKKEKKDIHQANILSGVGHELAHLHPFFGGIGNEESKDKWEQEMVCIFIGEKIRSKLGNEPFRNYQFQEAQEELKKNEEISWENIGNDWENFTSLEKFVYPWLEKKYGLDKLQNLWQEMFRNKKNISEAVENVFNLKIADLEENFKKDISKAKNRLEIEN